MKTDNPTTCNVWLIHCVGAAVCVTLLVSGWFFGFAPLVNASNQHSSLDSQVAELTQAAKQSQGILDHLSTELGGVLDQLDQEPIRLEQASAVNLLLAQLAGWADESEINITQTQAGRPTALNYYDYVPIQLSGEGAYASVLRFYKKLHLDRPDLGIIDFNLRRLSGGTLGFDLNLAWYVASESPQTQGQAVANVPTN